MEITERIAKIESLPTEKLKVRKFGKEFDVYPWIKSRIFHKFLIGKESLQGKTGGVLLKQLSSIFYGFGNWFRRYDAWAFTNSSERTLIDGKYFDKLFDPLEQIPNFKVLVIENRVFNFYKRSQVASKHVVARSILLLIEEIYQRIFLRKLSLDGSEVLTQIEEELGVQIDTQGTLKKYVTQYRILKLMLKILPNPKIVFHTVSYANFGYILALKERNIKVIELQHGLIGTQHYGYHFEKEQHPNQFPDYLFVFGEKDATFLQKNSKFPIKKAIPVGRHILDAYLEKSKDSVQVVSSISVSLQDEHWSIELLKFILEVDKLEPNRFQWKIKTRRTPIETYKQQFDFPANFEFEEENVYECIVKTDVHLTIFSTTAIEALSIGKAVLLYNFDNASKMYLGESLKDNPFVQIADNPEEFLTQVKSLRDLKKQEIAQSNRSNFAVNYIQNIQNFIQND